MFVVCVGIWGGVWGGWGGGVNHWRKRCLQFNDSRRQKAEAFNLIPDCCCVPDQHQTCKPHPGLFTASQSMTLDCCRSDINILHIPSTIHCSVFA